MFTNATYVPCLPVSTSLHWVCTQNCFLFDPEFVSVLRAYLYTCSCQEKCHSFGPSSPIYGNENRSFPLNVPAILIKKSQASALSLNTLRGTRNQTVSLTRAISKCCCLLYVLQTCPLCATRKKNYISTVDCPKANLRYLS